MSCPTVSAAHAPTSPLSTSVKGLTVSIWWYMSQAFNFDLASLLMSSWGNDMSVYMVVANNMHQSSYLDARLSTST